jgi:hypothetical protein
MGKKPIAYIKENESVFVAGRTGSGKSFLAQKYLTGYPAVIALDTKEDLNWVEVPPDDLIIIEHLEDLPAAAREKEFKIVYRPALDEMKFEFYEEFFRFCYLHKNLIVWVDEVMSICPDAFKCPEYYKGILTRGRSRNTAVWSCSQRPSGIPQVIMSESKHFYVFDLNMPQDREKLAKVTGCPELLIRPNAEARDLGYKGNYYFWYYYVTWENAKLGQMAII